MEHLLQHLTSCLACKKKKSSAHILDLNLSNLNFKPLNLVKLLSARLKSHQLSIFIPFDNRHL